jgi:hypothetical protein
MEKTTHRGRKPNQQRLEDERFEWVDNLSKQDIIVETKQIIIQAFLIAETNNYKFLDIGKYHSSIINTYLF